MVIPDLSGGARDTVQVSVGVNNADDFVAFQLSLKLNAQLTYLEGSAALTSRAADHTLSAGMVSGDTLRILAYSTSGTAFSGHSGSVMTFRLILGTIPGTYALNPSDAIIGDSSSNNILTGVTNGQLTLSAPEINLNTNTLNYTRTIVGNHRDLTFTISNNGNTPLTVDSLVAAPSSAYNVLPGWSSTVSASGSQVITVRFAPPIKGSFVGTVKVYSDDPDEPCLEISLSGIGYKINELRVNNLSTRSGTDTTLSFRINNQETFTGFQFDLTLPSVMTYLADSEQLTGRANGHSVDANVVAGGKVRVVAYSSDHSTFSGDDGDVVKIGFHVEGTGGSYSLPLSNVIITDSTAENILSDYYNGQLSIAAGDIHSSTSIDYGSVSILDTAEVNFTVQNVGNDTLFISNFAPNDAHFWVDVSLPLGINPSHQAVIPTYFHSSTPGAFSGKYILRSNDPDEDPYNISISATAYSPNTMDVEDATGAPGGYVDIYVDINNHDPFTAFQLDLVLPSPLTVVLDSCMLTSRNQGHTLSKRLISGNTCRFVAYSDSRSLFTGNNGAVLRVLCSVSGNPGTYPITIQNPIIGDINSQDILSSYSNGTLTVSAAPQADFSGTPTSGCSPLTVNFTDLSTGDITSWSWNFGDGGTSTAQNPSHTYANAGTYTVSLTVTGPCGSDTETKVDYITVSAAPQADFSGTPTSGPAPLTVGFSDLSTGNINSWSWDFGDGSTSTTQNPSHTYANPGTYTVSLTVTGPCGSDTETKVDYISVSAALPVIESVSPNSGPTSGGTEVVILGSNFGTEVSFGDSVATLVFDSSDSLMVLTPSHPAGVVDVVVTNSDGQADTLGNGYTYVAVPTAPSGLEATAYADSVGLKWNANTEPYLHAYYIYRDTSSPASTLLDSVVAQSPPDTFYTDVNVVNGMTYYYRVTAVDSAANVSGYSNEVSVMPYAGPVWYVSPIGNDTTGNGSESTPWRTINYAVSQASAGDTIKVMDDDNEAIDDYTENITVDKSLTIERYNDTGPNPQVAASDTSNDVFYVTADSVTIKGLDIYRATDNNKAGIYLDWANGCTIQNNRCGWNSDHRNWYGVRLRFSNDNAVSGNTCSSNNWTGISMQSSNDNTMSGNTCSSNNECGIWLFESSDNIISGNTCSNNSYGIYQGGSSNNNTIYLNNFSNSTTSNVYSDGSTNTWHSPTKLGYLYGGSTQTYKSYMGNYYSDYSGSDSDNNGIGDSAYDLPADEPNDEYPLMETRDNYDLQVWVLANPVMYLWDMSRPGAIVSIGAGTSEIWTADQPAQTETSFGAGDQSDSTSWTGQITFTPAPAVGDEFKVEVGYADDQDGTNFWADGPEATITGDGSTTAFTYATSADSFTVEQGKYLALKIINNSASSDTIRVGGSWSYCSAPQGSQALAVTDPLPSNQGWNLLSTTVIPPDSSVASVMAPILDSLVVVRGFNLRGIEHGQGANGGLTYDPNLPLPFSTLKWIQPGFGYWMKTLEVADTLEVVGSSIPVDTPLALNRGWNLVAYLPEGSMDVATALESIGGDDLYSSEWTGSYWVVRGFDLNGVAHGQGANGGLTFDPTLPQPFSTLKLMMNNFGYWIKLYPDAADTTLVYPVGGDQAKAVAYAESQYPSRRDFTFTATSQWMDFYGSATVDGEPVKPGDVVTVYDPNGVQCGGFVVQTEGLIGFIPVYADDQTTADVDEGATEGDRISFYINGHKAEVVSGSPVWTQLASEKLVLAATAVTSSSPPKAYGLSQNHPNPFNLETGIAYQLPKRSHVELVIYNLMGQVVKRLVDKSLPAGRYKVQWDGKDEQGAEVASGVYFYRIQTGKFGQVRKMVLLR